MTGYVRGKTDYLRDIAGVSSQALEDLIGKQWVIETEDDPHLFEGLVLRHLYIIARHDRESVELLVRMPFLDTTELHDVIALGTIAALLDSDPHGVAEVLSLPELADGITDEMAVLVPMSYLGLRSPEEAAAIEALPWFQDSTGPADINDVNKGPSGIQRLQRLATEFPQVFWTVMKRPWIQGTEEGLTWDRSQVILYLTLIAEIDASAALLVLELPFLETFETSDEAILFALVDLFRYDPEGARALLSNSTLLGGGPSSSAATLALQYLKSLGSEWSTALETLDWVQDGIGPPRDPLRSSLYKSKASLEHEVIVDFMKLSLMAPDALLTLLERRWAHDGLDIREFTALDHLQTIASFADPDNVTRIVEMPFLASFERFDLPTLENLVASAQFSVWALDDLLSDPALRGGITDDHIGTVALLYLKLEDPEAAETIWALPWVEDGIGAREHWPILALQELALESPEVFRAVAKTRWLFDGLDTDEETVVRHLNSIGRRTYQGSDESTALKILGMPFLATVNGVDAAALRSLSRLKIGWDKNYLQHVLSHPSLRNGITDDQAFIVAAMLVVSRSRPELLDTLLDPSKVTVDKRVVRLPHSGDVILSVVQVNPATYGILDKLERIVKSHEAFMAVPLEVSYVGLVTADDTVPLVRGGPGGVASISSGSPDYIIALVLAFTYWHFPPQWITQGGASLMATVSSDSPTWPSECGLADTLSEIDLLYQEQIANSVDTLTYSGCYLTLGHGLFLDLYDTLGDEAFREAFGRLNLALRYEEHDGECEGLERGICYVRAAFVDGAPPEAAYLASPVIERWYYGPR